MLLHGIETGLDGNRVVRPERWRGDGSRRTKVQFKAQHNSGGWNRGALRELHALPGMEKWDSSTVDLRPKRKSAMPPRSVLIP
jgi:hypothetical protein